MKYKYRLKELKFMLFEKVFIKVGYYKYIVIEELIIWKNNLEEFYIDYFVNVFKVYIFFKESEIRNYYRYFGCIM